MRGVSWVGTSEGGLPPAEGRRRPPLPEAREPLGRQLHPPPGRGTGADIWSSPPGPCRPLSCFHLILLYGAPVAFRATQVSLGGGDSCPGQRAAGRLLGLFPRRSGEKFEL